MTKKEVSRVEFVLKFFTSLIRSKYFWRGFALLSLIGLLIYLLYSDITCDGKNKKITSKGKMKTAELDTGDNYEKN